jgi:hypothetical protein
MSVLKSSEIYDLQHDFSYVIKSIDEESDQILKDKLLEA